MPTPPARTPAARAGIDEIDVQLLSHLQADGRITNADLAKAVGLSAPSVLQRVRNLEKSGIIKSYTALLDAERLGYRLTALTTVSLALHEAQPVERFRKAVQEIPEIVETYHVTGEFDFLLKILVRDMRHYEALLRDKILKIRGIAQIKTSFVLGTTKHTTEVHL